MTTAEDYCAAHTYVFWDVEDFPIPEDHHLWDFRRQVGHALVIEGYVGSLSILAFAGIKTMQERAYFNTAAVEKRARLNKMLLCMCEWAHLNSPTPYGANYLIVAKDCPEQNSEFFSLVQYLKKLGYSFFFAVPDGIAVEQVQLPPSTVSVVWHWKKLFDGKHPIKELDSDYECDEDCEEGTSQAAQKRQKIADAASLGLN